MKIWLRFKQALDKLVYRLYRLETVQRDRVLYARIMCIEGDDVVDAHVCQFLKSQRAVEGFAAASLVLAPLI